MTTLKSLSYLLCFVLLYSCSSDDDMENPSSCEFTAGNLQGDVDSNPYNFREGIARADGTIDDYQVFLFATDEIAFTDPCNESAINFIGTQLTFFVAGEAEFREFAGTRLVSVFNATTTELIVTNEGCYEITAVNGNMISGKLTLDDPEKNLNISGNWQAQICN